MSLSKAEFEKYSAEGFNRIPLMREVLADLDTPLSTYLKLARGPYSYLFESVQGGEKWGRYSIIGLPCRTLLRVRGDRVTVEKDGKIIERETVADPLDYVRRFKARYTIPEVKGLPRFTGGLVGYFGYEAVRYIEPRLGDMRKPDAIGAPDILLMVSDEVVVFDNLAGKLYVVIHVNPRIRDAYRKANRRLDRLVAGLRETGRRGARGRWRSPILSPASPSRGSRRRWRRRASISAPATSCRWCCRSGSRSRSRPRRSTSTAPCAR